MGFFNEVQKCPEVIDLLLLQLTIKPSIPQDFLV